MTSGDIFKQANDQFLEKDLVAINASNWDDIKKYMSTQVNYQDLLDVLREADLEPQNLYYIESSLFRFWYIEEFAFINIYNLDAIKEFGSVKTRDMVSDINREMKHEWDNKNYARFFGIATSQFVLKLFLEKIYEIDIDKVYDVFKSIYTKLEYGFHNLSKEIVSYIFSNSKDTIDVCEKVDNEGYVTIYRGQSTGSANIEEAYSWTTDEYVALFFASRFNIGGKVFKAKVKADKIKAFIRDRGEEEVIVFYEDLQDVCDMEYLNCSKEQMTKWTDIGIIDQYNYYKSLLDRSWFFDPDGVHGLLHTKRVLLLSLIISYMEDLSDEDTEILAYCSIVHDIGRIDDSCDDLHGKRSVDKLIEKDLYTDWFYKDDLEIIKYIIKSHSISDKKAEEAIWGEEIEDKKRATELLKAFKDADNLDRVRIGDLDTQYLRTSSAKKLPLVAIQFLKNIK